jgi:hypothetical protein
MERVRETGLQDLDSLLFPGARIAAHRNGNGILNRFFKPPVEPGIDRDEFYVVNSLIQLMETVFVDLNMDEERSHPHNAGWIEIFRGWAKSPRLQAVWQDSGQTYSSRFQRFCERTLELKPPRVEVTPESSRRLSRLTRPE